MANQIDVDGVISFCSGLKAPQACTRTDRIKSLMRQIEKHGIGEITFKGIVRWVERKQIPVDWLINLHVLAARQKKVLILQDYILGLSEKEKDLAEKLRAIS